MKATLALSGFDRFCGAINDALDRLQAERVIERIHEKDHRIWKPEPAEIADRLGWLDAPVKMRAAIRDIEHFAGECRSDGFTDAVLLGMGGSSLAPEVLRNTFGFRFDYLDLSVLDSTDPGAVLYRTTHMTPARTIIIVSTKSGTTVETLSLFRHFHACMVDDRGSAAGSHFTAITDPGSSLEDLARHSSFRQMFLNDPTIGGRYSALSYFGLLPAALCGIDISYLLIRATAAAEAFTITDRPSPSCNPAAFLGVLLGTLAGAGQDKLTCIMSPRIAHFGVWLEQLIAESLGKEGRGILPVVNEPDGPSELYGSDRLFLYLKLAWDQSREERVRQLTEAGHPVITVEIEDLYELGGQFYFWQAAIAVAGHVLSVNPFDQPDVETSKRITRGFLDEYRQRGILAEERPSARDEGIAIYGAPRGQTLRQSLEAFLEGLQEPSYVSILAYLQPRIETDRALEQFRRALLSKYRCATTVGYGPRYLHSTGQLHKGDGGAGLFIIITANDPLDVHIPDEQGQKADHLTFGILTAAQARGDREALRKSGRPVLAIHLGDDIGDGLFRLARSVA